MGIFLNTLVFHGVEETLAIAITLGTSVVNRGHIHVALALVELKASICVAYCDSAG